jgi:hypothetical protein
MGGKIFKGCDDQVSLDIQMSRGKKLIGIRNSILMASDMEKESRMKPVIMVNVLNGMMSQTWVEGVGFSHPIFCG